MRYREIVSEAERADDGKAAPRLSNEELRAAAEDVMRHMRVTPTVHWHEGVPDDLEKGFHVPGSEEIRLNSRAISSAADARGVMAHELMHYKFGKALQRYEAEKHAGTEGPAHAALWTFLEGPDRDKLRKAGGVSSYSQRAWRQAALRPDLLGAERGAHHETLAEIARMREAPETVQGPMKIKPVWRRYFAAVNRLHRSDRPA